MEKKMVEASGHDHEFCSALQFPAWSRGAQSLTEKKEIFNDGEVVKLEVQDKEVFEVERAPLLYTWAPRNYQRNPQNKRLNHTSVVEKASYFWKKEPSFSKEIEKVDYDAP